MDNEGKALEQDSSATGNPFRGEDHRTPMNHTPQNTTPIAFVNVNVVPMDSERILPGQTVIVRGDRISEIGPVDAIAIPEGVQRIDGDGKYLMPGLVEDGRQHRRKERVSIVQARKMYCGRLNRLMRCGIHVMTKS